ncbi:hypothetical protein, partial [Nocardia carnea]|uniref:hypothetical protein n=1 Tax=Nocardia carnea TaxID=37328 RepID=UPI0024549208
VHTDRAFVVSTPDAPLARAAPARGPLLPVSVSAVAWEAQLTVVATGDPAAKEVGAMADMRDPGREHAGTGPGYRLMDEVLDIGDAEREDLDYDLGDDDQADEVREYERYITDPPDSLIIRYHENDDTGRLGIARELDQEWSRRRRREELRAEDTRPAETAAMEVHDEPAD